MLRPCIGDLDAIVESLPEEERSLFRRIFHVGVAQGSLKAPRSMRPWIREHFGSVAAVTGQRIVRVTNLVTLEGALFNELRARRPLQTGSSLDLEALMEEASREDLLSSPGTLTPEDSFGRVQGKHCLTAGNVAKYDGWHGMVVFEERHPLRFSQQEIGDYLEVGLKWAKKAHAADPSAKYYLFMWNCLWRAGASLLHGHAQVMLARDMHYAKVEHLRRASLSYKARYGSSYFDDLYRAHLSMGLAWERENTRVLVYLAPIKDKEVMLLARDLGRPLKEMVYQVLACYRDRLGVSSFNLVLYTPPLAPTEEDWQGFPTMVRLVDRGDLSLRASDMGAMELYASSVIASDPFAVAGVLKEALGA